MLELILIRHGECENNKKGVYCGWNDVELTPEGISQAERLRDSLAGEKIDLICSSDLRRTLHTAEIINEPHGVEIMSSKGLRELNFGSWQDMAYSDIRSLYPKEYERWKTEWLSYRIPGGESMIDFYERVIKACDDMIEKYKDKKIVIVTHSGSVRCILSKYIGENINTHWHFRVSLGSITRMEFLENFAVLNCLNFIA